MPKSNRGPESRNKKQSPPKSTMSGMHNAKANYKRNINNDNTIPFRLAYAPRFVCFALNKRTRSGHLISWPSHCFNPFNAFYEGKKNNEKKDVTIHYFFPLSKSSSTT